MLLAVAVRNDMCCLEAGNHSILPSTAVYYILTLFMASNSLFLIRRERQHSLRGASWYKHSFYCFLKLISVSFHRLNRVYEES